MGLTLFGVAADHGLISVAAVLYSLSPLATIVAAVVFLRERLSLPQMVAISVTGGGVILIALGG